MIKHIKGNIFRSRCQTLVNPVNMVGVMGAGLALQFKRKFPDMYAKYGLACSLGYLGRPGDLHLYTDSDPWVLNFPTRVHYQHRSTIPIIRQGLISLAETYKKLGITSVAFPELGCGLGGLSPQIVIPLMEEYLARLPIDIHIYINHSAYKRGVNRG